MSENSPQKPSSLPARKSLGEPQAVILCSDLYKWLAGKIVDFPRKHKFTLGDRLLHALLAVFENLVISQYSPGAPRAESLRAANTQLQIVRHFLRWCGEFELLSARELKFVQNLVFQLGSQIGAWRKISDGTANSSRNSASMNT